MVGRLAWDALGAWDAGKCDVSAAFEEAMFHSAEVEAEQEAAVRRAVSEVGAVVARVEAGSSEGGSGEVEIGRVVEAAKERVAVREAQKRVNRVRVELQHTLLLLARSWDAIGDSRGDSLPRRIDRCVVADAKHTRHVLLRVMGVREVPVTRRRGGGGAEVSKSRQGVVPGLAVVWKEGRARDLRREEKADELKATLRWVKECKAEKNLIRITAEREEQRVLGVHLRYHEDKLDEESREKLVREASAREGGAREEAGGGDEGGMQSLPWRASFLVPVEADEEADEDACRLCGEAGARMGCSGCREAKYCGEACQRIHWRTGHREVCRATVLGQGSLGRLGTRSESESDAEGLDVEGIHLG